MPHRGDGTAVPQAFRQRVLPPLGRGASTRRERGPRHDPWTLTLNGGCQTSPRRRRRRPPIGSSPPCPTRSRPPTVSSRRERANPRGRARADPSHRRPHLRRPARRPTPRVSGFSTRRARRLTRRPCSLLSGFGHGSVLRAAIDRGAAGYLDKGAEMATIVEAIRTVAGGGTVFRRGRSRGGGRRASPAHRPRARRDRPGRRRLDKRRDRRGARAVGEDRRDATFTWLFDRYGLLFADGSWRCSAIDEGWAARP